MNHILLDNIVENLPVGVLVFAPTDAVKSNGQLVCCYANATASQLLNISNWEQTLWSAHFPFAHTVESTTFFTENSQRWLEAELKTDDTEGSIVVTLMDVTATQQRLGQLDKQLTALRKSNGDLEHFAYVASHDLREPLRKISAFGERLQKKYNPILDGDGALYLSRITDATSRMQDLIDDLLTFSRLTRDDLGFKAVNLNEIIQTVVSNVDNTIDAQIDCDEMPTIQANQTQMTQLFQNLVSNALKFRHQNTAPKVRIGCRDMGENTCEITVSDNGIGFDADDAERIFVIFQRLNGRSEYEGTGIGLAICKKIVENHNGTISAQGKPNGGATFTVTLPIE